jgi:hypothetical protein
VRIWAVPGSATLTPDATPEQRNNIFDGSQNTITLSAAINETVGFQLGMKSDGLLAGVQSVDAEPLRMNGSDQIASDYIRFYRQEWITVESFPAWYLRLTPYLSETRQVADPLVPIVEGSGALPIGLKRGRCEAIWVDVHVPPGTEPGIYRGGLKVGTGREEGERLNLVVHVWPFALPQVRHVAVVADFDTRKLLARHLSIGGRPYSPTHLRSDDPMYKQAVRTIEATLHMLNAHRLSPVTSDLQPARSVDSVGDIELDWTDYDRLVGPILDGSAFPDRQPAIAWPMPLTEDSPSPAVYGGLGSARYNRMLADYMAKCAEHFEANGWLDRHYVPVPLTAADAAAKYRLFERFGRVLKESDPRLQPLCTLWPQSMEPYGWVGGPYRNVNALVGVWAVPGMFADPAQLAAQRSADRRTWLIPSHPPYSGSLWLAAMPTSARSLPLQAYRFGCEAVFLPKINDWPDRATMNAAGSEQMLIWPGRPHGLTEPIPSVRLKRLRRGLQDCEYLWLLEQNRRGAISERIAADLFAFGGTDCYVEHFLDGRAGGWIRDANAWELARRIIAEEIVLALEATGAVTPLELVRENTERIAERVAWTRHTETVRQVRADVEGIRALSARPVAEQEQADEPIDLETLLANTPESGSLLPTPAQPPRPVELAATLSVFNASYGPARLAFDFVEVPPGWRTTGSAGEAPLLAPFEFARQVVMAEASSIPTDPDGVVRLGIQRVDPDGLSSVAPGRLCLLTVQPIESAIRIDGRLDDWPMGTENVASDFLLVGGRDVPKVNLPHPIKASQRTTVFVCRDAEYLYIAFNCEDRALNRRGITRSNYVRYDGLWPTGEDLVEVILDPAGTSLSPGDLYHVVVKANGAVIAERGAACLEPIGAHAEWTADVVAAVDDRWQGDRWGVEVRIPLRSLGETAEIWGANFGRFHARSGEYSSWSGARRYLYSPVSLGNLRPNP